LSGRKGIKANKAKLSKDRRAKASAALKESAASAENAARKAGLAATAKMAVVAVLCLAAALALRGRRGQMASERKGRKVTLVRKE